MPQAGVAATAEGGVVGGVAGVGEAGGVEVGGAAGDEEEVAGVGAGGVGAGVAEVDTTEVLLQAVFHMKGRAFLIH